MIAWALVLVPLVAGLALWSLSLRRRLSVETLGALGVGSVLATLLIGVVVAVDRPRSSVDWGGALELTLAVDRLAAVVALLVPFVAAPIVTWAAIHEAPRGRARLIALLVVFVGAMELLVIAGDLLTLLIGWELVAAVSWLLIGHEWPDPARPAMATEAFLTTRIGDVGLFLAAGAALAGAGSLRYESLGLAGGVWLDVIAAGIVAAALAKSAQLPFSAWLFAAMAGPSSVSALLHSATMVAAGAYLLARLSGVLAATAWAETTILAVGLATALVAGAVAVFQDHAKRLLAASTSAQYGLMIVAVGAGAPVVAIAHMVGHAAVKALLFLAAGMGITASGSESLSSMRLGRALPVVGALSAVGALALAGVPPLGAAWSKEQVVAATGHVAPWLAILVALAGGLSALYATRFQLLAFGPGRRARADVERPRRLELVALALLGAATLGFGLVWLPGGTALVERVGGGSVPSGAPWELALSLALVALALLAGAAVWGRPVLGDPATASAAASGWLGLSWLADSGVGGGTRRLAASLARFDDLVLDRAVVGVGTSTRRAAVGLGAGDDRVVDRGVRASAAAGRQAGRLARGVAEAGVEGLVGGIAQAVARAGRLAPRAQTGMAHHYMLGLVLGVVVIAIIAALGRS